MLMTNNTLVSKDLANKKLEVIREFNAPVAKVWKAWTESAVLDKWWAPRPWKAETKTFDFREGGLWLYCMVGPDGTRQWCRVDFKTIATQKSFTSTAVFSDDKGNRNNSFPAMHWSILFQPTATGSKIEVRISFDNESDLQKILEMGFEAGFTMGLGNLDELLAVPD
jgi:uncharacterized protein YndB with AHSA1/START domain